MARTPEQRLQELPPGLNAWALAQYQLRVKQLDKEHEADWAALPKAAASYSAPAVYKRHKARLSKLVKEIEEEAFAKIRENLRNRRT